MTFAMTPSSKSEKRMTPPSQVSLEDLVGSFRLGNLILLVGC